MESDQQINRSLATAHTHTAHTVEQTSKIARKLLDRIKSNARSSGLDTRRLLTRFALERWLYRMVSSGQGENFVLKGGMMMPLLGEGYRPTEDIDGQWFTELSLTQVQDLILKISSFPIDPPDGLEFDCSALKIDTIREGTIPGARVTFRAWLRPEGDNPTEIKIKIDLCYGDAIVPQSVNVCLPPALKGMQGVDLEVLPWTTVVAEKFHAITQHGMGNSRMKDYYDLTLVSRTKPFDGLELSQAISSTFERRDKCLPSLDIPGLSEQFVLSKQKDWNRFLQRGGIRGDMPDFKNIVKEVSDFILPPTQSIVDGNKFTMIWNYTKGWQPTDYSATKDQQIVNQ